MLNMVELFLNITIEIFKYWYFLFIPYLMLVKFIPHVLEFIFAILNMVESLREINFWYFKLFLQFFLFILFYMTFLF